MEELRQDKHAREGVKTQAGRKWYSLIDKIWAKPNLEEAFREVKRNRGAAGVDRVTVKAYESTLESNLEGFQQALKDKKYRPKPVKRVYIPKADGTQRPLGIPTVEDRVVQAAARRVLEPLFEEQFMACSYGFRPGRSAHMALENIRKDLADGYRFVIDADIVLRRHPAREINGDGKVDRRGRKRAPAPGKLSESRNHGGRQLPPERAGNAAGWVWIIRFIRGKATANGQITYNE
ncbi:reverse transcriptase domain-containing protein [Cohnella sp. REN36]|uniref:reverse transcriptase domain-containing protein n=1 Tax=Cohnella sp. REN36 TaxID=2887347 RepID=UPI001D159D95|nr:reverse transcriptase domain-containing protein [Cohnella sp. REN36]MCC3373826.1 hypothetical protein [Cohnella sp. REN36]